MFTLHALMVGLRSIGVFQTIGFASFVSH